MCKPSKKCSVLLIVCGAVCLLAGFLLCLFAYTPFAYDIHTGMQEYADGFGELALVALPLGIALLLTGSLRFPLANTVETHCTKRTVCLSLLCAAALGIGGLHAWLWKVWRDNEFNDAMYAPPLLRGPYIRVCWISLAVLILCVVLYVRERRKQPSVKGVLLDVGLCVLYIVPFATGFVCLRDMLVPYLLRYLE